MRRETTACVNAFVGQRMYGLFSTLLLVLKPFLSKFKIVSLGKCYDRGVETQPKERGEATSRTCNPNRIERDWARVEERDFKA